MRKFISVLIIAILIIINFNLLQSSLNSSQKLNGVNKIEEKIGGLEKENKNLKTELQKANSSFYIEKEARNKLGFGKAGETTIVVTDQLNSQNKDTDDTQKKSNLEKWIDLLVK